MENSPKLRRLINKRKKTNSIIFLDDEYSSKPLISNLSEDHESQASGMLVFDEESGVM